MMMLMPVFPVVLFFEMGDAGEESEQVLASLWYDESMKKSMNADGISFRLLDDGALLLTTPTGQYQIPPQNVADLYDLLCTGQAKFLDAMPDLPTWARETTGKTVMGQVQVREERSVERYRQEEG